MSRPTTAMGVALVALSLSIAWPTFAVEPVCPVQLLSAKLELVGAAGQSLRLLNGSEDPRLRRVLEQYLTGATTEAKALLAQGADPKQLPSMPNTMELLRRASEWASKHMPASVASDLEHLTSAVVPPASASSSKP